VLALDAKEMAVTLPLVLFLYEIIFHTAALRHWRAWLTIWMTGAITLVYIAGKLTGPGSLIEDPAYALTISPGRFLDTFHLYLNPLFYQEHWFHDSNTVQILIGMLVLAALLRSRVLLFAWFWLLLTVLPVAFIGHYAAFFMYLPAAGWALYAAALLVTVRRAFARLLPPGEMAVRASQSLLFLGLAAFLAPLHARESPKTLQLFESVQPPSREIFQDLARLRPAVRHGARILFVDDPFAPYFLPCAVRLFYRDLTVEVERTQSAPSSEYAHYYDAVFGFRGNRLIPLGE
jgi:hypothetical protein